MVSIFWGALWGITEATLGHLAHMVVILPAIAGFIMFPIAFYFMTRAYRETGKIGVLFSTATVAASIKLVDLFLPGLSPIHTINPAIFILIESLAVILVFKVMSFEKGKFRFKEAFTVSIGWRLGYIIYYLFLFTFSISREFFQIGIENILRFLILESIINALIIAVYLKFERPFNRSKKQWFASAVPVISLTVFTIAILLKFILAAY